MATAEFIKLMQNSLEEEGKVENAQKDDPNDLTGYRQMKKKKNQLLREK